MIKDIDNNTDAVTIFFTENEEFAINYITKYNNILDKWKNYFLNIDTKAHELDRRDFIDSIVGCYYEEVSIRGEIPTLSYNSIITWSLSLNVIVRFNLSLIGLG